MATINPLRYRGYYYDTDTGFYYRQNRYYDPAIGRFINADSAELSKMTAYNVGDSNMFAYCGNNPVTRDDKDGECWNIVIEAVVGGLVNAVTTAIDSYAHSGKIDWGSVAISAAVGAVNGGVAATGLGLGISAAISGATSAAGN